MRLNVAIPEKNYIADKLFRALLITKADTYFLLRTCSCIATIVAYCWANVKVLVFSREGTTLTDYIPGNNLMTNLSVTNIVKCLVNVLTCT